MKCINCNTEIASSFKHAIIKNECPYCGGNLAMDEETTARVAEFEETIGMEVPDMSPEVVKRLAKVLAIKYGLKAEPVIENMKIAKPSFTKQAIANANANVMRATDMNEIGDEEREAMMAEAAAARYGLLEAGINLSNEEEAETQALLNPKTSFVGSANKGALGGLFQSSEVSILEQERLARLAHQQNALATGGGSKGGFRRSG